MVAEADKITRALEIAARYGGIDGAHHKMWVIDQMVRALTGGLTIKKTVITPGGHEYEYECQGVSEAYKNLVKGIRAGEEGPDTYEWNCGIAP